MKRSAEATQDGSAPKRAKAVCVFTPRLPCIGRPWLEHFCAQPVAATTGVAQAQITNVGGVVCRYSSGDLCALVQIAGQDCYIDMPADWCPASYEDFLQLVAAAVRGLELQEPDDQWVSLADVASFLGSYTSESAFQRTKSAQMATELLTLMRQFAVFAGLARRVLTKNWKTTKLDLCSAKANDFICVELRNLLNLYKLVVVNAPTFRERYLDMMPMPDDFAAAFNLHLGPEVDARLDVAHFDQANEAAAAEESQTQEDEDPVAPYLAAHVLEQKDEAPVCEGGVQQDAPAAAEVQEEAPAADEGSAAEESQADGN